jgi:hypothetical protein
MLSFLPNALDVEPARAVLRYYGGAGRASHHAENAKEVSTYPLTVSEPYSESYHRAE